MHQPPRRWLRLCHGSSRGVVSPLISPEQLEACQCGCQGSCVPLSRPAPWNPSPEALAETVPIQGKTHRTVSQGGGCHGARGAAGTAAAGSTALPHQPLEELITPTGKR